MLPGQDAAAVVPGALLDLIAMLPPSHDYVGPSVDVDDLMFCLREIELPGPPEDTNRPAAPRQQGGPVANAPSSSDIFRMRQQLKSMK
jgi:hypothetical protein